MARNLLISFAPVVIKVEVPNPAEPVVGIQFPQRLPFLRPSGLALLQFALVEDAHHRRKEVESRSVEIGGGFPVRGRRLSEVLLRAVLPCRQAGDGASEFFGRDVPRDVLDLREHARRPSRCIARQRGEALRPYEDVLDELVLRLDRLGRGFHLVVDGKDVLSSHGLLELPALERLAHVLSADTPVAPDLEHQHASLRLRRTRRDIPLCGKRARSQQDGRKAGKRALAHTSLHFKSHCS